MENSLLKPPFGLRGHIISYWPNEPPTSTQPNMGLFETLNSTLTRNNEATLSPTQKLRKF